MATTELETDVYRAAALRVSQELVAGDKLVAGVMDDDTVNTFMNIVARLIAAIRDCRQAQEDDPQLAQRAADMAHDGNLTGRDRRRLLRGLRLRAGMVRRRSREIVRQEMPDAGRDLRREVRRAAFSAASAEQIQALLDAS